MYKKPIPCDYYGLTVWMRLEYRKGGTYQTVILSDRDAQSKHAPKMGYEHPPRRIGRENEQAFKTAMSDWDKRYVMGHEILINKKNQRDRYNNMETIYKLGEKMDRCVFSRKYHESIQTVKLRENKKYDIENVGVIYLRIPKESLRKGGILRGSLCTEECGDPIAIAVCDSPKLFQTMELKIKSCESVPRKMETVGINCEYDNWKAHKKATAAKKT